jgi:hypothetical protein
VNAKKKAPGFPVKCKDSLLIRYPNNGKYCANRKQIIRDVDVDGKIDQYEYERVKRS